MSGAASGGLAGAAFAGLGSAASIGAQLGRAAQAGAASAPLFADASRVQRERDFAGREARLSLLESANAPFEGLFGFSPFSPREGTNRGVNPTEARRNIAGGRFLLEEPADRTSAQLGSFFGDIAAAGGQIDPQRIAALSKIILEQNRKRVQAEAQTQGIVNAMNGVAPVLPGQ